MVTVSRNDPPVLFAVAVIDSYPGGKACHGAPGHALWVVLLSFHEEKQCTCSHSH